MSNEEDTLHVSLQVIEREDHARNAALERIKNVMMAGAVALAGTRSETSTYWIEREFPGPDGVRMIWRPTFPHDLSSPSTCDCENFCERRRCRGATRRS